MKFIRAGMMSGIVGTMLLCGVPAVHAAQHNPGHYTTSHKHHGKRSHQTAKPVVTTTPAATPATRMAALLLLNTILNDITPCSQQFHLWFDGYDVSMAGTDTDATIYKAKTVAGLCQQAQTSLKSITIPPATYQREALQKVLGEEQTVVNEYSAAASAIVFLATAYSDVAAGSYDTAMTVVNSIEPSLIADVNQLRTELQS